MQATLKDLEQRIAQLEAQNERLEAQNERRIQDMGSLVMIIESIVFRLIKL